MHCACVISSLPIGLLRRTEWDDSTPAWVDPIPCSRENTGFHARMTRTHASMFPSQWGRGDLVRWERAENNNNLMPGFTRPALHEQRDNRSSTSRGPCACPIRMTCDPFWSPRKMHHLAQPFSRLTAGKVRASGGDTVRPAVRTSRHSWWHGHKKSERTLVDLEPVQLQYSTSNHDIMDL